MEHENAFSTGPVRCVSAATYLRLRFLDAHTIAEEVRALCVWGRAVCVCAAGGAAGGCRALQCGCTAGCGVQACDAGPPTRL